jgi:hypothetical protein
MSKLNWFDAENPGGLLKEEPGYKGAFTRREAQGAEPNGTTMEKVGSVENDAHPDGSRCAVLGSLSHEGLVGYFVEWEDTPKVACFITGFRLKKVVQA